MVGLAIARAAALAGHEVIVAEAADGIGTGVSSRNSEVIHAGLYYPTGSKRALSLRARAAHALRLLRLARRAAPQMRQARRRDQRQRDRAARGASSSRRRSTACEGVEMIEGAAAKRLEPDARLRRRHALAGNRHRRQPPLHAGAAGDLEDRGGVIALNTPIERLRRGGRAAGRSHFGGADPQSITVDAVVNSAGLGAQKLGRATEGYPRRAGAAARARQGQLFRLRGPAGVLAADLSGADPGRARRARDARLAGRMRFGPDVEWIDEENYDVDPARAAAFYAAHPRLLARPAGQFAGAGLLPASGRSSPGRASRRWIS